MADKAETHASTGTVGALRISSNRCYPCNPWLKLPPDFSVHVVRDRDVENHAFSEIAFALLRWRRQQEGPLEGVADHRIKDSTLAGLRCVARAGLARRRCRRGPRRKLTGLPVQPRNSRLDGEAARNTGRLPPDIVPGERRKLRRTFRPNVSRQDRCAIVQQGRVIARARCTRPVAQSRERTRLERGCVPGLDRNRPRLPRAGRI